MKISPDPEEFEPPSDTLTDKGGTPRHEAGKKAWETMQAMADATLANLVEAGLIRPPLEVEREYRGVRLTAGIRQGGKVLFAGEAYDSLSTAGGMARKMVIGAPKDRPYPQTNGWQFWQYCDGNGELQEIDQLRRRYLARAPGKGA